MPTGGGKSLCYQLPAMMMEGTAIVFSPLIALMKDQVDSLKKMNIPAALINSTLSFDEINKTISGAMNDEYKILYLAPERLESVRFQRILNNIKISFIAVDEAHCISEWGHDFRPAYLSIVKNFDFSNRPPLIALTATATPEVRKDISEVLKLVKPNIFIRGFDRPNLIYNTAETLDKISKIKKILSKTKSGSSIIYCGSRKRVEEFSRELQRSDIKSLPYHAGFPDNYRKYVQDSFFAGQCDAIVATNAFGLGIDKADVRNVIHVDFTQTLEGYYQEAGRAGRDGKAAECWLLYQYSDRNLIDFFIKSTYPDRKDILKVYNAIYNVGNVSIGEKPMEPVFIEETELANLVSLPVFTASSVISLLERQDVLMRGSTEGSSTIQFTTSRERMLEFLENSRGKKRDISEALLRSVNSDAFNRPTEIDLNHVAIKYGFKTDELMSAIHSFQFARMLKFTPSGTPKGLIIKQERMNDNRIGINFDELEQRRERANQKFSVVLRYAQTPDCKRNFILSYFKETDFSGYCGKCSSCTGDNFNPELNPDNKIQISIVNALSEMDGRFGKTIYLDFLGAKQSKKILDYKLNKLDSFGVCRNIAPLTLKSELEECISSGLIAYSSDIYPTLHLTRIALDLIGNKEKAADIRKKSEDVRISYELLEDLKHLRAEIASVDGVVQRAVISDKVLKLIAHKMPKTSAALKAIEGVNNYFISRYSAAFLKVINKESDSTATEEKEVNPVIPNLIASLKKTKNLQKSCRELKLEIAETSLLLQEAIESGAALDRKMFIDDLTYFKIRDYVRFHPFVVLRELKEELRLDADFPVIRLALAFARRESKKQ